MPLLVSVGEKVSPVAVSRGQGVWLVPDCSLPPPPGHWSTPATTGRTPPPSTGMTLTRVDRRRVVWFGGVDGQRRWVTNALFILDIEAWVST